ncbi:MAG: hypothetical protein HYR88_05155 [Verrucomicrobia bacterium]|nr:hypothetical protein [Verrucomicrobiota bacterium]
MKKHIPISISRERLKQLSAVALAVAGAAMESNSTQAATLAAGWDFEKVEADGITIKSVVGDTVGIINGSAMQTDANGGRPNGGGHGFDVSFSHPGWLQVDNKNGATKVLTTAAANDSMTAWTAWHHYAFVKDHGAKRIYVDGNLLIGQLSGANPLDVGAANFRFSVGAADKVFPPDAVIDDFAIFKGVLSEVEIKALANGSPLASVNDTDGDGMPDTWEIAHGFNPNDPSDAAKDCDGDGVSNLGEYMAGADPCDITPPTLVGAAATETYSEVIVTFSETVDPVVAANKSHYSITPALLISAASAKGSVVTLITAPQAPGATKYTVKVNGVMDTSKNKVPANSTAVFYSYLSTQTGVLKLSYWGSITGTPVDNLYDDPRYPTSPDFIQTVFSFNSRDAFLDDSHENFGATIEGYLTPTESGDYRFFLASDDASQLFLSTDNQEANLTQIAEQTSCCNVFTEPDSPLTSEPIPLVAGKNYFIRAAYKEGSGSDYLRVAWRREVDPTPASLLSAIPGKFLSSATRLSAPPEGAFLTQRPGADAKDVAPNTHVTIVHRDGKTAWTANNTSLTLDGVKVAPTFNKEGSVATIDLPPSGLLASNSLHTVALGYLDAGGDPATLTYSFTVLKYDGPTKDKVRGYPAVITGAAVYSENGGGHSGKGGDYAMDLTTEGGAIVNFDATWVNAAFAKDEVSVGFWIKRHDIQGSSAFWFNSPSSNYGQRGFQAHVPWSDNTLYYDTAGCCGIGQRSSVEIATFPDYSGNITWWTANWHYFVFSKKAHDKQVWIDGKLFLEAPLAVPLPSDITSLYLGSTGYGTGFMHAVIDDFAVFSTKLSGAQIFSLASGLLPSALGPSAGLVAYWDFNDIKLPPGPKLFASDAVGGVYSEAAAVIDPVAKTATIGVPLKKKFFRLQSIAPSKITGISVKGKSVVISYQ